MIRVASASHVGLVRERNEDSLVIGPLISAGMAFSPTQVTFEDPGITLAVVDGMGGHVGGAEAAQIASRVIAAGGAGTGADPAELLIGANAAIYDDMEAEQDLRGMGATAAVARIDRSSIHVANVGDARVYAHAGGMAVMATIDDRSKVSSGGLTQSLGGLGERSDVEPHTTEVNPSEIDRLLLCTDGLSDELELPMIQAALDEPSPLESVRELLSAALSAGGRDNLTAIVVALY